MIERLTIWVYFWEAVTAVVLAFLVTVGLVGCGVYFLVVEAWERERTVEHEH